MPPKRTKKDFAPHIEPEKAHKCAVAGCVEAGVYKAPKSREEVGDYIWLCLEHVRERNQKWDYFSGMKAEEIEAFISDSVTGHRPTWSREERLRASYFTLQDKLYEFMTGEKPAKPKPQLPAKTRKALAVMELDNDYTEKSLKAHYRKLVKKYHPDINKNDKVIEEKFKQITIAYKYLLATLKS